MNILELKLVFFVLWQRTKLLSLGWKKILRMRIGKKEFMDMDLNMRLIRIHFPIGKPFRFLGSMEYGIIRVLKDIMG